MSSDDEVFDLSLAIQKLSDADNKSEFINEILRNIVLKLQQLDVKIINRNIENNKEHIYPFLSQLQSLLLNTDETFEESILAICEIVSKLTQASPNLLLSFINELLLNPLVLNTAHPLSSVRKNSRSCIANYVRQYKNLRPILKAFTEHGINQNPSCYSKQCIILILPNLLNLDPNVINLQCTEFVELCQAIIVQLEENDQDLTKSIKKVIGEMLKRFPDFEKIYQVLQKEARQNKDEEEYRSRSESPKKVSQATKQKSVEFQFGFIDQQLYQRMSQNGSLQEKTKAFEEALNLLQSKQFYQEVKVFDFLSFLAQFLGENSQNLYASINTFALRMINFILAQYDHQQIKTFNFSKLSSTIANKLVDNNKLIKQESHLYFSNYQRCIGIYDYIQRVTSIMEYYCNLHNLTNNQLSILDSLLNLLLSCSQKIKNKNELDLGLLIKSLHNVLQADGKQVSKIIEILYILSGCIDPQEIYNLALQRFPPHFISKLEEKLKINQIAPSSRRTQSINQPIFNSHQVNSECDSATLKKKTNLLLPNINHLSQTQQTASTNKSSSLQSNSKSISSNRKGQNKDYFANTEQAQTKNYLIKPISKRYDSTTDGGNNPIRHPQSPFTTTTMSSLSGKIAMAKKKSEESDKSSQNNSNYGSFYIQPSLVKNRGNSQSHSTLPSVQEKIPQKQSSVIEKIPKGNLTKQRAKEEVQTLENSMSAANLKQALHQGAGKLSLDPSYFQQTINSLTGTEQFSSKTSNKPGSGFAGSVKFMRATNTSLGGDSSMGGSENKYLSVNDLEPLVNFDLEWKLCLTEIKSDNWSRQFESCNTLRKVFKFHLNDLIYEGKSGQSISKTAMETFHDINSALIKQVESLRSSVAKQAMITLNEMFESVPKQLIEQDQDSIFNVLIKKSIDANIFMAEEAEKTLISMCRNLPEQKMLNCLMNHKNNKNSIMRSQICRSVIVLYIRLKQKQKKSMSSSKVTESERQMLSLFGNMLSDSAQEVRNQAKIAIRQVANIYDEFSNRKELFAVLGQSLNDSVLKKVQDFIESECV